MYSIHDYGDMTGERRRIVRYEEALRASITSTSVVLDIGAGAGIMTLLACRAGARKVYAVEPESVIQVAREAVAANGYGDRVEFIQGLSTDAVLAEKVDVVVSDLHGVLPFFSGSVASILDARDRLLKPGGTLVPRSDTLWVTLADAPAVHGRIVEPWQTGHGFDFAAARRRAVNTWRQWRADPAAVLVEPKAWAVLDYGVLASPRAGGLVEWTAARACTAHGLCMWFDCETLPGLGFSNAPGTGDMTLYHQAFFPWPEACPLSAGDSVSVEVRADPVGDDYVWTWNTELRCARAGRPVEVRFRQSEFLAAPVSIDWRRKTTASFVPSPNTQALIDRIILDLLVAGSELGEIARELTERFPERYPEWRKALTHVGNMSLRYSD